MGHLGSLEHERRVKAVAARLFDLTLPLHRLSREHRRLLCLAATVHDVGRSVDDETHPRQGARLLREARGLPLPTDHRQALIYMTRHHRGKIPPSSRTNRQSGEFQSTQILLALLRAADSLDSRTIESPRLVVAVRGRRIHITCYLDNLTSKARRIYGRRKKFALLEELLDCRVEVNLVRARALEMVA